MGNPAARRLLRRVCQEARDRGRTRSLARLASTTVWTKAASRRSAPRRCMPGWAIAASRCTRCTWTAPFAACLLMKARRDAALPLAKAAEELAVFIAECRAAFPGTQIGLITNFPNWHYTHGSIPACWAATRRSPACTTWMPWRRCGGRRNGTERGSISSKWTAPFNYYRATANRADPSRRVDNAAKFKALQRWCEDQGIGVLARRQFRHQSAESRAESRVGEPAVSRQHAGIHPPPASGRGVPRLLHHPVLVQASGSAPAGGGRQFLHAHRSRRDPAYPPALPHTVTGEMDNFRDPRQYKDAFFARSRQGKRVKTR